MEASSPKTSLFLSLPTEIQLHIFSFLTERDLIIARIVSSFFKELADHDAIWSEKAFLWDATIIAGNIKKSVIEKIQEFKRLDRAFHEVFPEAPVCSLPLDQYNANREYFSTTNEPRKDLLLNNPELREEELPDRNFEAMINAIENGELQHIETLCFHGIKPHSDFLLIAIHQYFEVPADKNLLDIVLFFINKWGDHFEQEVKKEEEELKALHDFSEQRYKIKLANLFDCQLSLSIASALQNGKSCQEILEKNPTLKFMYINNRDISADKFLGT